MASATTVLRWSRSTRAAIPRCRSAHRVPTFPIFRRSRSKIFRCCVTVRLRNMVRTQLPVLSTINCVTMRALMYRRCGVSNMKATARASRCRPMPVSSSVAAVSSTSRANGSTVRAPAAVQRARSRWNWRGRSPASLAASPIYPAAFPHKSGVRRHRMATSCS